MTTNTLYAISPIDGRYASKVEEFHPLTSEYGLIHHRVIIEIRWLEWLVKKAKLPELKMISPKSLAPLLQIIKIFSLQDAEEIKRIEQETQHDVKAVEYFIREKLRHCPDLLPLENFIHFAYFFVS